MEPRAEAKVFRLTEDQRVPEEAKTAGYEMKIQDLARRLSSFEDVSLGSGASETEIDAAAATLGVPIRGGYRAFLQHFGYGGVADIDLYGLGRDVPKHLHLVEITESERAEMEPNLPHHLLPIWNNGAGDHACLDTRASPDEPPVIMWYHEDGPDQVPHEEAPSFLSWFAAVLASRVSGRQVERPFQYVEGNLLNARELDAKADLDALARSWMDATSDLHLHDTPRGHRKPVVHPELSVVAKIEGAPIAKAEGRTAS